MESATNNLAKPVEISEKWIVTDLFVMIPFNELGIVTTR